jgi:ferredoxin
MMRRSMVLLAVLAMGCSSFAELKLATLFSDGMVLQRDQKVAVWGWTDPGAEVTVSFAGKDSTAKAGVDGKFVVRLKKMKASAEPRTLKVVSGSDSADVKNVLVGEVWLCSGQSNMLWPVKSAIDFEHEKVRINPVMCQGCGTCAAVCPNSASVLEGFLEQQMFEMIDAAVGHDAESRGHGVKRSV